MNIMRLWRTVGLLILLATLGLGLASFLRAVYHLVRLPHQIDFTQFYVMAYMLRTDHGSSFYDPDIAQEYCTHLGVGQCSPTNYPPFVAVLFYPLSLFTFRQAEIIHLCINLLLTAGLVKWAWHRTSPKRTWVKWSAIAFVLLLPATTKSLMLGQINAMLGCLLCIAIVNADNKNRHWLVIGCLSLASAIKLWPIALVAVFIVRKQHRLAIGSIAGFLFLTTLGLVVAGPKMVWQGYFTARLPESNIAMAQSGEAINQSVWGVATRLFRGETTHQARLTVEDNKEVPVTPLVRSMPLYWISVILYVVALATVLLWVTTCLPHKTGYPGPIGFWAVFVGLLTVLPFSWDHYAFFLIFPFVHLLSKEDSRQMEVAILGTGCLLLLLIQRFSAYLPQHGLLLAFGFVAEVAMIGYLVLTLVREWNEDRDRHPIHAGT